MTERGLAQAAPDDQGKPRRLTVVCKGCGSIMPGMKSDEGVIPYSGTCPKGCGREFEPYATEST